MNKVAKVATNYVCESCNYSTFKKSDFEKHLQTQKHKNRTLEIAGNEKVAKVAEKICCQKCDRIFKSNSGLWKHNQICQKTVKHTESGVSAEFLTEFMLKQQQANAEMMKNAVVSAMKDIAPHMGNNNTTNTNSNNTNQFNINVFLNEDCKQAINMSDFIKSIEVSLEQLDLTKTKGLEKGITQVIMDNMNKLSIYERPLHCTDAKRETLYIKDNDKWEKDNDRTKIKEIIKKTQNKNYTALTNWTKENPKFMNDDAKQMYYAKAMSQVGKSIDGVDEKIIKQVCKQTYVKDDLNMIE
tara:strand:- start:1684 stop:2577 length:894 start_codon:yes stop_codon:yes gene_type:complete